MRAIETPSASGERGEEHEQRSVKSVNEFSEIAKSTYAKSIAGLEKGHRTCTSSAKNPNTFSANALQPREGELMHHCDLMPDDSSALSSKLRAFSYASQNASRTSIARQHNRSEPLL